MISVDLWRDDWLRALREQYRVRPVVVAPEAVEPAGASGMRTRLLAAGLEPYYLADRGRYRRAPSFEDRPLFEDLRDVAEEIAGERFDLVRAEWRVFGPGDYALEKDDALRRPRERFAEVTVDFSETRSGAGELLYIRGDTVEFAVPNIPGILALIERSPDSYRSERYVSLSAPASIWRLSLTLVPWRRR